MDEKTKRDILYVLNDQVVYIKTWVREKEARKHIELELKLGAQSVLTCLGFVVEFDEDAERFTKISNIY